MDLLRAQNRAEKNCAKRGLAPSAASCGPLKRGVVLSVEALLAALLLFTALLLASTLAAMSGGASLPLLRQYAHDVAAAGVHNGAWLGPVASSNDAAARSLIDNLPAGLCVQAEVYAANAGTGTPIWSYARGGCNRTADTALAQAWAAQIYRGNSTNYSFEWVRVRAYPREG